ncbi:type II secretion system secretin GspD [Stakelama saccharophila]|uniref:Type II secretion system secretin GspD n=1 Tax=Stakelama saccharophila TaxID=3075605 RepID=A0ABZ0BBH9_9SPHN|nr:type II secretion system secretin GspD [Stakelama sp. W311]WNO54786.1 type II secretion system secretin GspD [Stakelama sp. W311]
MLNALRTPIFALALAGLIAQPAAAQDGPPADIVVNMHGVDIAQVAEQISRLTGRTLILDPAVKGEVTVTSAQPLSPAGVWELFQSVLRANGFAAVRSGRAWRIVPQTVAVRDGGAPSRSAGGEQLVTRMIRLSNVPAEDAARIARPLVATFGSVEPLSTPNAIVVTDYADNVARIQQLVNRLDSGGGSSFTTIQLDNGNAPEVADSIQSVMGDDSTTRVAADARSNSVIVRGTPASVAQARSIAASLDKPGGATPITRMFRLNYADAESVTEVLRGVLGAEQPVSNPVARSLDSRRGLTAGELMSSRSNSLAGGINGNADRLLNGQSASDGGGGPSSSIDFPARGDSESAQGFSTPDLTVQPAPSLNAVVVRGTPKAIQSIDGLIHDLDVRRPQVHIEAAIAEIRGDEAEQLGVQLGLTGGVLSEVEGGGTSFDTAGKPLSGILSALGIPAGNLLGNGLTGNLAIGDDFSVLVQALGTSDNANLLSTPQVTVLDNSPAEIVVGQNVPFVTGSILTDNSDVTPYTTIERRDVGITLKVIPRINAGEVVRLDVSQEVSSLASITISGASDLITNRRQITTKVLADNGETIVLGGLISDDRTESEKRVPLLGDIPVIGNLFRARREEHNKRILFIFLRPTILRDTDDADRLAKQKYARLRQEEQELSDDGSLLINPPAPRLTVEIDGIY